MSKDTKYDIIKFLLGEGEYKGKWFGELQETEKGAFWWRKYLREYATHLPKEAEQWVSVKERLPEISIPESKDQKAILNKVQIFSPSTIGIDTGYYWGTSIDDPLKGWSIMGVTHWMPLPQAPTKD